MQIVNVMAASLDGRIGLHAQEGDSERQLVGISGEQDQLFLRKQIESSDAIIVGASSIRANGQCLEHRGTSGKPPVWYIFAEHEIDWEMPFWKQDSITRVLISKRPLKIMPDSGVTNLTYEDLDPCDFIYSILSQKGYQCCLLFGGGVVNRWFYKKKRVDILKLTIAPVILGKADAPMLVAPELTEMIKLSLIASQVVENFVFLTYSVDP